MPVVLSYSTNKDIYTTKMNNEGPNVEDNNDNNGGQQFGSCLRGRGGEAKVARDSDFNFV